MVQKFYDNKKKFVDANRLKIDKIKKKTNITHLFICIYRYNMIK